MTHYSLLNDKDPVCEYLTEWRIVEADGKVDPLSGPISFLNGYQMMNNVPEPWGVPHYNTVLPLSLSMKLEVDCEGSWKTIDQWTANVKTCLSDDGGGSGGGDRFPTKTLAEYGCYQAPAPCDCQRVNGGDCTDPPYPCPLVCKGSLYAPPNGAAYKFTGAIDGEWTNLKNWKDFAGVSPANQLPDANSVIVIDGNLQTIPTGTNASVDTVTVTAAGAVRIPLSTTHAEVRGIIGIGSSEACGNGVLVMAGTEAAEFKGAGYVEEGAEVTGNANFNDTSHNDGTVTLDASFTSTSFLAGDYATNSGTGVVKGFGTFSGIGANNAGTVEGDATFNNSAINYGTVQGTAYFSGATTSNYFTGHVEGAATFTNGAFNQATCEVDAAFTTGASNAFGGTVQGNATFNASSNLGDVVGNATLTAGSSNGNSGNIQGNAVFTDSSSSGSVVGTATFNVTGTNSGTVGGLATFNGATIHAGVLTVNAIFNGYSHNEGTVGDATFNNNAYNNAIVTGVATFNLTSHNDAANGVSTAIFNGGSINNGAATTATFNNTSSNAAGLSMTIGTATFNNTSENNGYVSGNATFSDSSSNRGPVAGNASFNTSSYNACVLGAVAGTATYNGLTGPVSLKYYILGQCTTLDSTGSGYWNSTYYYNGIVFDPTLHIFTGAVDGDWNNLGNWKPDANLPLLAERLPLSTENVELRASVTNNGGSQPTVTNLLTGTASGQTFSINLTVLGTATFSGDSIHIGGPTGGITGNVIFNNTSSNPGTVSGNATFNENSSNNGTVSGNATFNNTSLNEGTVSGNATWMDASFVNLSIGTVSGTKTFSSPAPVVFVTNYGNSWTYDSSSWNFTATPTWLFDGGGTNNAGTLNGDATFQNSSYNTGTVSGNAAFNSASSNPGTVSGNATFDDTSSNGGIVSGNATWSGSAFTNLVSLGIIGGTKTFSNASPVVFTTNGSNNWNYNSSSWTFATPGPTWIFEGSSSNLGILAGDATFNNSSNNNYIVSGNATFNGSSSNVGASATVSGNATFNGSSNQLGTVTGTTTCNTEGTCP